MSGESEDVPEVETPTETAPESGDYPAVAYGGDVEAGTGGTQQV